MAEPLICNPPGHLAQSQSIPRPLPAERSEGLPGPPGAKTWVLGTGSSADRLTFRSRTMTGAIDDPCNLAVAFAHGCITH